MGHNNLNSASTRERRSFGSPEASQTLYDRQHEVMIAVQGVKGTVWSKEPAIFEKVEQERQDQRSTTPDTAHDSSQPPVPGEMAAVDASALARMAQAEADRMLMNPALNVPTMAGTTALDGSFDPESQIDLAKADDRLDPGYYDKSEGQADAIQ